MIEVIKVKDCTVVTWDADGVLDHFDIKAEWSKSVVANCHQQKSTAGLL